MTILLILFVTFLDGVQDAITFARTLIGEHPYGDFWHLVKHLNRLCLILYGAAFVFESVTLSLPIWYLSVLQIAFMLFCKKLIWNKLYISSRWLYIDKKFQMPKMPYWLEKLLGFHN